MRLHKTLDLRLDIDTETMPCWLGPAVAWVLGGLIEAVTGLGRYVDRGRLREGRAGPVRTRFLWRLRYHRRTPRSPI